MTNYPKVLTAHFQHKQWTISGNDYETLIWHDETTPPTKSELDTLWNQLEQLEVDKATAKASAIAKLGLTADEVAALLS